jgi:ferric-dicitrate binding protein FerR (iron transport regulator)
MPGRELEAETINEIAMKDEQTYSRDRSEQTARYLGGEMDEAQQLAFREEAVAAGEWAELEELEKRWTAIGQLKPTREPDMGKAWEKVMGRLQDEQQVTPPGAKKRKLWPVAISIAAACVILAGISTLIWLQLPFRKAPDMISVNTAREPGTLVKTLADGSVIYIAENTVFSFPESIEKGSRDVELRGEAFFDIAPDAGRPFMVETDAALVKVLGTAFNVKSGKGGGFELAVERGKVQVTLKSDPTRNEVVVAGEKVISRDHTLLKSKHGGANAWYRQRIRFRDESLENIIRVLNRNFSTNFAVDNPATGSRRLTVAFQGNSAGEMAELICLTLNLKSRNIHGAVVFTENTE